jgi:hypothetical protein
MIGEVTGSETMKSKPCTWPLLLGVAAGVVLFLVWWGLKDDGKRTCSTVPAAVIASNPNLKRSMQIEKAKKECIEYVLCRQDELIGYIPCEFTAYDLKECTDIDPALGDFKVAQRHLEAEVETCDLEKTTNNRGVTVYRWKGVSK